MSWIKLNVSITSGGVVTRNSGDPIASILAGQALQVVSNFYEVKSVSSEDFTLEGWDGGAKTVSAKILPTVGDVVAAAQSLREVSVFGNNLLAQLAGLATGTGTKVITSADGVEHDIKTFPQLALDTADSFNEFGLGLLGNTITMLPTDSIDDLSMPTGFFRVINSHTGLRPDGFSIYGVISVTRYDSSLLNQQYTDVNNKIASRVVKSDGVGDWSIEFNSGNSVNPLDFGIGKTDTTTDLGNFNDGYLGRGTGLSRSSGSSQGAPEGLSERNAVVLYMRRATSPNDESIEGAVLRIGTGSNPSDSPDVHIKSGRGTSTSEWIEMFHSGNSINPLDFGLGTTAKHIQDFDAAGDNPRGSEFMAAQPSTQNQPTGSGTNNWAGFRVKRFDTSYFEFWAAMSENRYFARSYNGGYKDWAEFFTSENSVNPLDFGVGVGAVPVDDADAAMGNGFFIESDVGGGFDVHSSFVNVARTGAGVGWQLAGTSGGGLGNNDVYLRARATSSVSGDFGESVEILHDGNTNLDVFGSEGGAKILAQGVFVDPHKATFLLPLSSNGVPFSITLGLGGFQVTKNGFNNVEDNIPPSRVVLGPRSSYKLAEIEIEGFSGQTSGDPVFLRTVDGSTKITVNF